MSPEDIAKAQTDALYGPGTELLKALVAAQDPNAIATGVETGQNRAINDIVAEEQKKQTGFKGFDANETGRFFGATSAIPDIKSAATNAKLGLEQMLNVLNTAKGQTGMNLADSSRQREAETALERERLALQEETARREAAARAAAAQKALTPKEEASIMYASLYQKALDDGYITVDEMDNLRRTIQDVYGSSISQKDLDSLSTSYFPEGWAAKSGVTEIPAAPLDDPVAYQQYLKDNRSALHKYIFPAPMALPGDPGYKGQYDTRGLWQKTKDVLKWWE